MLKYFNLVNEFIAFLAIGAAVSEDLALLGVLSTLYIDVLYSA